jgi:hypothetical protein
MKGYVVLGCGENLNLVGKLIGPPPPASRRQPARSQKGGIRVKPRDLRNFRWN